MWTFRHGWLCNEDLEESCGVFAAVSTAALGDMSVVATFEGAISAIGLDPGRWAGGRQVHGCTVRKTERPTGADRFPATDGVATDRGDLVLRILVADCVPVFVVDVRRKVLALVHAGWRGVRGGILTETMARLGAWYGSGPSDLRIGLGPHIGACCYEVGDDVAGRFDDRPGAVKGRGGRLYLDLAEALRQEAGCAGVAAERFTVAPFCTAHDQRFFSYRRDAGTDRMAAVLSFSLPTNRKW